MHDSWRSLLDELVEAPNSYAHIDAAQLVKHYLGLRQTFPADEVMLLYVYWEPENHDVDPLFASHRVEIAAVEERVMDSDIPLIATDYGTLWRQWEEIQTPWLDTHLRELERRYTIDI